MPKKKDVLPTAPDKRSTKNRNRVFQSPQVRNDQVPVASIDQLVKAEFASRHAERADCIDSSQQIDDQDSKETYSEEIVDEEVIMEDDARYKALLMNEMLDTHHSHTNQSEKIKTELTRGYRQMVKSFRAGSSKLKESSSKLKSQLANFDVKSISEKTSKMMNSLTASYKSTFKQNSEVSSEKSPSSNSLSQQTTRGSPASPVSSAIMKLPVSRMVKSLMNTKEKMSQAMGSILKKDKLDNTSNGRNVVQFPIDEPDDKPATLEEPSDTQLVETTVKRDASSHTIVSYTQRLQQFGKRLSNRLPSLPITSSVAEAENSASVLSDASIASPIGGEERKGSEESADVMLVSGGTTTDRLDGVSSSTKRKSTLKCSHIFAQCSCISKTESSSALTENKKSIIPRISTDVIDYNLYESVFHRESPNMMTVKQQLDRALLLGTSGLSSQYYLIRSSKTPSYKISQQEEHRDKNRYGDIVCLDHTRVELDIVNDDPTTDYINANHINGYEQKKGYICCQAPLKSTSGDHWRMIWQEHIKVVVMVTRLTEKGRSKSHRYWPDEEGEALHFDHFTIECKQSISIEHTKISVLKLSNHELRSAHYVYHLLFLSWPDYGVPDDPREFLDYLDLVRRYQMQAAEELGRRWKGHPKGPPLLVHCSAGVGRSGTFVVIDICLRYMEEIQKLNIEFVLTQVRQQRALSVQTPEQYIFCHMALLLKAIEYGFLPADTDIYGMLL